MAQSIEEILTPESGHILRQAREARGLSIDDIAVRLRLHRQYIEGIEAGDLRSLPPGPYRKAFIKEYAKFLNIKLEALQQAAQTEERDGIISSAVSAMPGVAKKMTKSAVKTTESVVKKVEEGVKDAVEEITARDLWEEADEVREERLGITKKKDEEPKMSIRKKDELPSSGTSTEKSSFSIRRETRRTHRLELGVEPITQEFAPAYEREEEADIRQGMSRATKTIVGLLVIIAAIVGYSIFTKKQNQPAIINEPEQKTVLKQPEQKPKPVMPLKKDSASVITTPNDSLIFTISAKDSVWVSVSPDIGRGFRGKIAKGEIKRFSAKEKYFLFLGNQKSVSMTLNGRNLTNLPTIPGSKIVVRNVILTRDKISVAPAEEHTTKEQRKKIPLKENKKQSIKKNRHPQNPTAKNRKSLKNPPIKMRIPSVKPVLPG